LSFRGYEIGNNPVVNIQTAIENGDLVRWFTHE
jgi:hypothetical protein